ncbi:hypothetical protein ACQPYA_05015 [Micromonospora sp. CA-263727]|uniref:hypothetical protein n=1 Tax=Micromonospora sp. CA-263727 TaxID=3239967 RepID=UPI003D9216D4
MRDELTIIERLRHDLRDVRWPEPAKLRAVARRRSRFRAAGAAVGVLVVMSASAVTAAALPEEGLRTVTAPASDPRARVEIPLDALLQPEDMPTRVDLPFTQAGFGEPIKIEPVWTQCLEERGISPAWESSRYSRSQLLRRDPPVEDESVPGWDRSTLLIQDVYRISSELERTFFAGIERRIMPCLDWGNVQQRQVAPDEWADLFQRQRWEMVDRAFAGDESVLIRHSILETRRDDARGEVLGGPTTLFTIAVVRVGDLITVFNMASWGNDPELRQLAVVAAKRMCVAANPPC